MEKTIVGLLTILLITIFVITGCSFFGKKKELKPFKSEITHRSGQRMQFYTR